MTEPLSGQAVQNNTSTTTDGGTGQATEPTSPATEATSYNPAWGGVVNELPEQFRSKVVPLFEANDKYAQSLTQRYANFKDLSDTDINNLVHVYKDINTNPKGFYDRLGAALGVTPGQAQQMVADQQEAGNQQTQQAPEELQPGDEGYVDPKIKALEDQLKELREQSQIPLQYVQEQQQTKLQKEAEADIDRQVQAIKARDPNVDIAALFDFAQSAFLRTQKIDMEAAYSQVQRIQQAAAARYQSGRPGFVPVAPGGGMPPANTLETKTKGDRMAAFKAMRDQANAVQG